MVSTSRGRSAVHVPGVRRPRPLDFANHGMQNVRDRTGRARKVGDRGDRPAGARYKRLRGPRSAGRAPWGFWGSVTIRHVARRPRGNFGKAVIIRHVRGGPVCAQLRTVRPRPRGSGRGGQSAGRVFRPGGRGPRETDRGRRGDRSTGARPGPGPGPRQRGTVFDGRRRPPRSGGHSGRRRGCHDLSRLVTGPIAIGPPARPNPPRRGRPQAGGPVRNKRYFRGGRRELDRPRTAATGDRRCGGIRRPRGLGYRS